ncbi:M10 family metallopeptidase C-terminal domain-containing protein [Sphingomonas sp.]|uniref:calcium-binding protein n=1 Tax=Sphingomonas sp. TaxID=28214 RepID=UPI0025FFC493|nr:M10 family metallopeptidase C-terminal domain-containing protein [Sphingomonas sp.]MBV9527614.1 M10 family metallopeptidase C-terminal domain-containing protein [Sphingomonas sp.]
MANTMYVSPTGAGNKSGSSAANAAPVSALDAMVQKAGAGGTVNMLADKGSYDISGSIMISHGGATGSPVLIQGVTSSGAAADITINGTRAASWSAGKADGNTIFKLYNGANNLDFEHMHFNNVGMAVNLGGDLKNVTLAHMSANNVRYFTGNYPGGGATTANVTGFAMHDITVNGFSKSVVLLNGNASGITLDNVHGDGQYQDGDNFEMGIALQDTVHNVLVENSSMKNTIGVGVTGAYVNGDGFVAESSTYDIHFTNCTSTGNGDSGFDIKSSNATLTGCYAEDNKRNFRIWGTNITLTNCDGVDPHKRISNSMGSQCNLWVSADASNVTVKGGAFVDSGSDTHAVSNEGGSLHLSGVTIVHAANGDLEDGAPHTTGLDMSLVKAVAATGSYSTTGEQYLGKAISSATASLGKIWNGTSASDTYHASDTSSWTLNGNAGNDTLVGGSGADHLNGADGADHLSGAAGNDVITGGAAADFLAGNGGSDSFVYTAVSDSTPSAHDTITDFTPGTDKIDLHAIDADVKVSGNQAFTFIDEAAFSKHAGELHVTHPDATHTVLSADVNGDGHADFSITLDGDLHLSSGDFIL